jgi:hypothetical protein
MTNVMHRFLIYFLFTSALHVSGFLLAHLQRQVYNFGSGSSLLSMVSAPRRIMRRRWLESSGSEKTAKKLRTPLNSKGVSYTTSLKTGMYLWRISLFSLRVLQFAPVSVVPSTLHLHSKIYHRHYMLLATGRVHKVRARTHARTHTHTQTGVK